MSAINPSRLQEYSSGCFSAATMDSDHKLERSVNPVKCEGSDDPSDDRNPGSCCQVSTQLILYLTAEESEEASNRLLQFLGSKKATDYLNNEMEIVIGVDERDAERNDLPETFELKLSLLKIFTEKTVGKFYLSFIKMEGLTIKNELFEEFCKILSNYWFQSLTIVDCNFNGGFDAFLTCCKINSKNLEFLKIHGVAVDDAAAQVLKEWLPTAKYIRLLELDMQDASLKAFSDIVELVKSSSIPKVSFYRLNLDADSCLQQVCEIIQEKYLEWFGLHHCVEDKHIPMLCEALEKAGRIDDLYFSHNKLTDEGITQLALGATKSKYLSVTCNPASNPIKVFAAVLEGKSAESLLTDLRILNESEEITQTHWEDAKGLLENLIPSYWMYIEMGKRNEYWHQIKQWRDAIKSNIGFEGYRY